jgi:8-oxo-dGTP pyrophosphatase MutT (NUDIX family)
VDAHLDAESLARVVAAYQPRDRTEAADLVRLREIMANGDPRSRHVPVHVTASALIVHPPSRRVLLRWHAKMRGWLQVGGHFDEGEHDPWDVACREAAEETGLTDLGPLRPDYERLPVQIVIVPVPESPKEPAHEHADIRYALATQRPDDAARESPDAPLRWVPVGAAGAEVSEANLRECLRRVALLVPG